LGNKNQTNAGCVSQYTSPLQRNVCLFSQAIGSHASNENFVEISVSEAEKAISAAVVLLDILESDEFAMAHLPGAIHTSRGMLKFKLSFGVHLARTFRV